LRGWAAAGWDEADGGTWSKGEVMSFARTWWSRVVLVGLVAASLGACGSDGGEATDAGGDRERDTTAPADGAAAESGCESRGTTSEEPAVTVDIAMGEFTMQPSATEVPAGPVEMHASNDGMIWHELVVVRYDGDPGSIPQTSAGGADLQQLPEDAEVGRILNFMTGVACRATFDLAPGSYVLLCNLVDDGFTPHYSQGMYAPLTVT
jgi:hypothetical protein